MMKDKIKFKNKPYNKKGLKKIVILNKAKTKLKLINWLQS